MAIKKVSSTVLLRLVYEAYKNDPEGFVSDLGIIVDNEQTLVEFAQQAIELIEMDDEEEEGPDKLVEYEEDLPKGPSLLANR